MKDLNKKSIEPVSPTEIRAYFGLLLLFGVLKKPRVALSEIWAEDCKENIHHCSYATSTMSRDRFKIISCCISFAANNSFVLHRLRNPDLYQKDFNRQRRHSLENLAVQLIRLGIKSRIDKCSLNNFSGIRTSILNAIIKTGESINKQNIKPNKKLLKEEVCKFCVQENVRTRTNTACNNCKLAICRAKHSFIFCKNCSKNN